MIRSGQQILLADDASRFFKKVEFDPPGDGDVRRMHPAGLASPVVIDPLVRFGQDSLMPASSSAGRDSPPPSGRGNVVAL